VGGEAVIAAVIGAVTGGGGVRLIGRLFGPERDEAIAEYYRGVIRDLRKERKAQDRKISTLESHTARLEERISALELAQDEPPGHLG
jgi:hypothetical protein